MKDIEERVLSDIEEAIRAEGRDEGEHIGETRGRAEGEANKAISIVKNLLKMGVNTMKQISEITGLSQEKLRELKATLLFSSPHTTKPLKLGLFLYGNFFPCTGFEATKNVKRFFSLLSQFSALCNALIFMVPQEIWEGR